MRYFCLCFLCFGMARFTAQTNPFAAASPEHRLYELYLGCQDQTCVACLPEAARLFDRDPKPTMATELFYNYFVSVNCYFLGDYAMAESFAKQNQALLAEFEEKRTLFWDKEDFRRLYGIDRLQLDRLKRWNERAIGNKPLPNAEAACPTCPKFPFPPPQSSTKKVLDQNLFAVCHTLNDVERILAAAMDKCGYEKSYYSVPNGFALVARLEQINKKDMSPLPLPYRWSVKSPPLRDFGEYLRALIFPQEGHFRIVVFVVTDQPFSQSNKKMEREEAVGWLSHWLNVLPPALGKKKWSAAYQVTALIYEFKVNEAKHKGELVNSAYPAQTHLERSNLIQAITARQ